MTIKHEAEYCPCGCGLKMGESRKQVPELTKSEEEELDFKQLLTWTPA